MRCLALAQAWQQIGGRECIVIGYCPVEALRAKIRRVATRFIPLDAAHPDEGDLREMLRLVQAVQPAWIALDGYHFDPDYHEALGPYNLLIIDDNAHLPRYAADLLLNQNVAAERLAYIMRPKNAQGRIVPLLGPGYALLRQGFWPYRQKRRTVPEHAAHLLVTLGGSDPDNATLKVIQALNQLDKINVRVVVGAANPHRASLEQAIARTEIQLLAYVENMPELMAWADMGVLAGGTTLWEAALLGLPCLVLTLADNQRQNAAVMHEMGISLCLGEASALDTDTVGDALRQLAGDADKRRQMCELGQMLVDGRGGLRVVEAMSAFNQAKHKIREVEAGDAYLLWMWTNDPATRLNSIHPELILWPEHVRWLRAKLDAPGSRIWLYCKGSVPVGQIRYDRQSSDLALISYSVQSDQRGHGIGTQMLEMTAPLARKALGVRRLRGITFAENEASLRAFEKTHFQKVSTEIIEGRLCNVYEQVREIDHDL